MRNDVDVLAVMDEMASYMDACHPEYETSDEIRKARAAVVELIDFANTAEMVIRNVVNAGQIGYGYVHHADDLRAALSRVTGGAA